MAMIQVVVTLYEGDYQDICELGYVGQEISEDVGRAIKDGTILPKGHGKLIDADKLSGHCGIHGMCECTGNCDNCGDYVVEVADIKKAPTIIEVDEEELKEAVASEEIQKEHIDNDSRSNRMKFILNGCDISFIAEAPEDMTVKQLIEQADRIKPDWCACGVCKDTGYENYPTEIVFDYNSVRKASDDVCCQIRQV